MKQVCYLCSEAQSRKAGTGEEARRERRGMRMSKGDKGKKAEYKLIYWVSMKSQFREKWARRNTWQVTKEAQNSSSCMPATSLPAALISDTDDVTSLYSANGGIGAKLVRRSGWTRRNSVQ